MANHAPCVGLLYVLANAEEPRPTPQYRTEACQMGTTRPTVHEAKMPGLEVLHDMDEGRL